MTPTAARCARSACHAAIRRVERGDPAGALEALADARAWLLGAADTPARVREAVARCLADGHPWSDEELAMVARCSEEEARAARAIISMEAK